MSDKARIGWVVDAQNDFMDPDGRLYVKDLGDESDEGAVRIRGNLEEAVSWMRRHCQVMVFTGDWHAYDDEEIDTENPDPARGTYPPHCMGRSDDPAEREGAQVISSIRPENPVVLEIGASDGDARAAAAVAVSQGRPVFIHKNRFDVFAGNGATEAFLAGLAEALGRPLEFFVAGVARDVCVTQAVDGMQARDLDVVALKDATWGLGLEDEEVTLARWAKKGRVVTWEELAQV